MNCRDVKDLIPCYLSGELDQDRTRALEKHFLSCEPCARAVEADRWTDEAVRRACESMSVDAQGVIARVQQRLNRDGNWWLPALFWGHRRLAFATCGVLAVALVLVIRLTREESLLEAAAEHHRHEVIEHAPRDWYEGEAQAQLFRAAGITRDEIADLIKETGFELVRARECNLLGDR